MARGTWTALEDGTRRTAENKHAGIERALGWAPGSIRSILNGGQPTEGPSTGPATVTFPPGSAEIDVIPVMSRSGEGTYVPVADPALVKVMNSDLDDRTKAKIVKILIAEQERFARERDAHAEALIQAFRDDD